MKRIIFLAALILCSMAAVAQEFQVMSQPGKKMCYEVNAVTPIGVTKIYINQILEMDGEDKCIVNTYSSTSEDVEGQKTSISYTIANGEYSVSVKEVLEGQLAQLGSSVEVLDATNLTYPLALAENMEMKPASMRIKTNIQGMDLDMTISVKDRKTGATEDVTTPAGTFTCLKSVEKQVISLMGQEQVTELTCWYAKGIGLVKQVAVSMGGMVSTEMLLKKIE